MPTDATLRQNYIFVDYENVQDLDLNLIAGKAVKVILIVGTQRKTVPATLARQLHKYKEQVEWVESEGTSPNALDLVLAYQVGLYVKLDPAGYFHVLSRDKDYDPLIAHLRTNKILATRDEELSKVPVLIDPRSLPLNERVEYVRGRLEKNKASRPARKKTLASTVHAICHKQLGQEQVDEILNSLEQRNALKFGPNGTVTYNI